jgi:hemerythrin-like metal-binding protein
MEDFIPWGKECKSGIAELDAQHSNLISMLNLLAKSAQKHDLIKNQDKLNKTIDDTMSTIKMYMKQHFEYEEDLFKQNNYPKHHAHYREHLKLSKDLKEVYSSAKYPPYNKVYRLLAFFRKDLLNHILQGDKDYADFINPPIKKDET